jgi:uncharacterized membrane protein (DUF485 family)
MTEEPGKTSAEEERVSDIEHIKAHPAYGQLSAERLRLGLCLSATMATAYFAYILTVAFRPQALGTPLGAGTVMTWGLLAGVGVIALGFVLTALYVVYANARFDTLTQQLKEDVR